jgi:hypothetical protein
MAASAASSLAHSPLVAFNYMDKSLTVAFNLAFSSDKA